ncbi:hypothetical protein CR513_57645, partial [Mucuna pruriens]
MEVNSLNERGMSPLDVLMLFQSEGGDLEIYTVMQKAGAKRGKEIREVEIIHDNQVPQTNTSIEESDVPQRRRYWPRLEEINELFGYKPNRDSINDVRGIMLTIAALMTTTTYQAVFSPPGGLWQDDNGHTAGKSILATKNHYPLALLIFWISFNYSGSIISLVPDGGYSSIVAYLVISFGYLTPLIPSVVRRLKLLFV